jgi:hypothetical protein
MDTRPPLSNKEFLDAILDRGDPAKTAAFVAAITGQSSPNESRDENGRPIRPLTREEFVRAITCDDNSPSGMSTAEFVAAITSEGDYYPRESRDQNGRPAKSLTYTEWVNTIKHGNPHPLTGAEFAAAITGESGFIPREFPSERAKPGGSPAREGRLSSDDPFVPARLGEAGFDPDEPRDERGRWTKDASQGERSDATSKGSERSQGKPKSGRIWSSSRTLTWDDFKGTPPVPSERKERDGTDMEAETDTGIQVRGYKRRTGKFERLQPPPATATRPVIVGLEKGSDGLPKPVYNGVEVQNPPAAYRATATFADAKVEAFVDPNQSWALDSARKDPDLLEHERYHVRINEIAAAMAEKRIRAAVGVAAVTDPRLAQEFANRDLKAQAKQIMDEARQWAKRAQDYYDQKTEHGSDPAAQAALQRQIDDQLAKQRGQ